MQLKKKVGSPNGLPKQWLHWARMCGIKPESRRSKWAGWYMKGRDRYWRVCANLMFEVSCDLEHFDRWANSGGGELEMPKTKAEFKNTVNKLIELSGTAKPWFYAE